MSLGKIKPMKYLLIIIACIISLNCSSQEKTELLGKEIYDAFISNNLQSIDKLIATKNDINNFISTSSDTTLNKELKKEYLGNQTNNNPKNYSYKKYQIQYQKGIPDSTYLYPENPKETRTDSSVSIEHQEVRTAYKTIDWKQTIYLRTNCNYISNSGDNFSVCNIFFKHEEKVFFIQLVLIKFNNKSRILDFAGIKAD